MIEDRAQPAVLPGQSLRSTYVHLADERAAVHVPLTDSLWREIMSKQRPDLERGRLMMQFEFSEDWTTWEMHPAGEELVVLLSGRAQLVLELASGEQIHSLEAPGDFVIVPRGTWHTARVRERCAMLFLTPGEGTLNRPR